MRFRTLLLVFLLTEFVSYTAYFFPTLNTVGFFVIVGAALVLSLRRLEYGLYFVLAELILGGRNGTLYSFEHGGFFLSLRMALFIVVIAVWFAKLLSAKKLTIVSFFTEPLLRWWGVLGLAVGWGIVVGMVRGNNFGNLFLDANGYFYAAMVLPFVWVLTRGKAELFSRQSSALVTVFFTATTLLALKTLFAVYLFTHAGNNFIAANLIPFYRWVRETGVGEITWLPGNFARVFFQSQIYNVVAWFALLTSVISRPKAEKSHTVNMAGARHAEGVGFLASLGMTKIWKWALLVLNAAVILVSLSRSFWVGVVVGLIVLGVVQAFRPDIKAKALSYITMVFGSVLMASILLLIVARFPLPRPSPMDLSTAAQSRLAFEPAAASRWNLLPQMWTAVREHPILGSGFGRTVTYISNDPRVREVNPIGEYTTYAFEWGWLDFWLKLGLLGLIGPLGLILALIRRASLTGASSLAALTAVHFFTPYLNHPLGIGILILATVFAMDVAQAFRPASGLKS